jgi:hypothetical protein
MISSKTDMTIRITYIYIAKSSNKNTIEKPYLRFLETKNWKMYSSNNLYRSISFFNTYIKQNKNARMCLRKMNISKSIRS